MAKKKAEKKPKVDKFEKKLQERLAPLRSDWSDGWRNYKKTMRAILEGLGEHLKELPDDVDYSGSSIGVLTALDSKISDLEIISKRLWEISTEGEAIQGFLRNEHQNKKINKKKR